MKSSKSSQPVLGVMVTSRMVHAVLARAEASGAVVLQRFVRQRNGRPSAVAKTPSMANLVPELQEELKGSDFSIQFGDGAGKSTTDLFLKSEFAGFQADTTAKMDGESSERTVNFMYELSAIMEECREAGYDRPQVAFCVASSDVAHVELHVLPKGKKKGKTEAGKKGARSVEVKPPGRDQLLKLLQEQYKGEFEPEAVGFVPMTPSEAGTLRYVAIVAKKNEPVAVTLNAIRKQKDERLPSTRLVDTEGSLFLGLARGALRSMHAARSGEKDPHKAGAALKGRQTLVVRVGAEDTLLFFMEGERLRHYESMRSLTAFDSPDTICSRVLLQQDEYGVEEVHHVLLLSDEREDQLLDSFRAFFPEAEVSSIRKDLPAMAAGPDADSVNAAFVPAIGVAYRALGVEPYRTAFEDVNLVPRRLLRQQVELPFTWHTLVLSIVLFGTALFFGSRYVVMEQKIDEYRQQLRQYPPSLAETDPRALQARIDSMQNLYNGYMRALAVLDTLLIGSDQWSRGLEDLSNETAAVRGVWVENWQPGQQDVTITGNSTARDRVVQLAERLKGSIESLTFSEIREWPVYSFSMKIPLQRELPEAARYLREHALDTLSAPGAGTATAAQPPAVESAP